MKGSIRIMIGKLIKDKYKILEQFDEGGMGTLYKAFDVKNSKTVVVKVLRKNKLTNYIGDYLRFKKEAEIVSKLSHPNIIKIYDASEHAGIPYIVMEHLEGETLSKMLGRVKKCDEQKALNIIRQIAIALDYVNAMGIVHRDIKTGNIFITQEGSQCTVKLLDFGVAHILELSEFKSENEIIGTFGYMSPEASGILNRDIDERSDLYSLGVILYHMLTGELPFKEKELGRLLHQQAACTPQRPSKINRDISKVVDDICMKLLMKEPDMRYQSAGNLLHDIRRYEDGERCFEVGERNHIVKIANNVRLVGRKEELNTIKILIDNTMQGMGCLCLISGESGSGKSKLLEELKEYAHGQNAIVIKGRCLNEEKSIPYKLFKNAINEYISKYDKIEESKKEQMPNEFKKTLKRFTEISVKLNSGIKSVAGVSLQLWDLFFRVGDNKHSFIIFLEDLHWADEDSLMLLKEIAARIKHSSLMIIATYRTNEVKNNILLNCYKEESSAVKYINLEPLNKTEINRLAALMLTEVEENTTEISRYVFDKSKGNPMFAINLIRDMVESKAIIWNDGNWRCDIHNISKLIISDNVLEVILNRVESLSSRIVDLLCACSVIGREFNMELLLKVVDIDKHEVINIIDEAISFQILEKISNTSEENNQITQYAFVHHRIRDLFYCKLTENRRKQIHLRIANSMEQMINNDSEKFIYELADHYIEGGDYAKTIEYAVPAANRARLLHANEEAISYYEKVKALLESDECSNKVQWATVCQNLIEVYLTTGRNNEVIVLSQQLLPLFENNFDKAKLFKKIGTAYFKKGDWLKSEDYLLKALKLLNEKVTKDRLKSVLEIPKEFLKYKLYSLYRPSDKIKKLNKSKEPIFKEIISIYEALGWVYILSDTYKLIYTTLRIFNIVQGKLCLTKDRGLSTGMFWGMFLNISKLNNVIKYQEKALTITEDLGDELGVAKNNQLLGFMSFFTGNNVPALQYLKDAERAFRRIGDLWELGMVYNGFADVYFYSADYDKCIEAANKYLETSKQIMNVFGICGAQQHIACCMIETGNYIKAEVMLKHILKVSEENNVWSVYCTSLMYYGALEIERNNYDEAIKHLEKAQSINKKNKFFKQYTVLLSTFLAEAHIKKISDKVNKEDYTLTHTDISRLDYLCKVAISETKSWNQHYGQAIRITAQYYTLIERYSKAQRWFIMALEQTERVNRLFEFAKTYYEMGFYYSNIEDTQEAIKNWYLAYELFTKIGSVMYIEQCMKLLGLVSNTDESSPLIAINTTKERLAYERRINTVASTSRYISSILDIDQLLEKIMDSAIELVGAERGVLFLYPEEGSDKLEVKVERNMASKEMHEEAFIASQSIIESIEVSKRSIIINDALADESFATQSSVVMKRIRSVICSPIMNRGHMLGIIYLDSSLLSGLFSKEDLKILDLISNQAGVSIENARLYRKMEIYSKEIKESRDKTAKWNQTLEQRVRQRTVQLNALNRELNEKNALLESMNKDLKEYATAIEELSITRERNRVAIEVHDTLGHSLTLLLTLLEGAKLSCTKDIEDTKRRLGEATEIARNGMSEIRRSISGLLPERLEGNNVIEALEPLISKYQSSGINVEMSVDDINIQLSPMISEAIYKICQEAMTNSVRHGKATEINIILRRSQNIAKLYIFDNGIGCNEIKEGFGLYGMRHRIEKLGGSIILNASSDSSFNIRVEIPM